MKLRCSGGILDGQTLEVQDDALKGDFVPVLGKVAGKLVDAAYEIVFDERGHMCLVAPVTTKED